MDKVYLFFEPKGSSLRVLERAKDNGYKTVIVTIDKKFYESSNGIYSKGLLKVDQYVELKSWSEKFELVQRLKNEGLYSNISGVYNGAEISFCCYVSLLNDLDHENTYLKDGNIYLDKFLLRKKLNDLNESDLIAYESKDLTSLNFSKKNYFFKPKYGLGSYGVSKCSSVEDGNKAIEAFNRIDNIDVKIFDDYLSQLKEGFFDEEIEGELLSVEVICTKDSIEFIGLLSRIMFSEDSTVEMGSCFPYDHPLKEKIYQKTEKILKGIGIVRGPLHIEYIVTSDGRIELIDLNPRFVGADVIFSINFSYSCEIESQLFEACLVKPSVDLKYEINPDDKKYTCVQYFFAPKGISKIEKIEIPNNSVISKSIMFKSVGDSLPGKENQFVYIGCFFVTSNSFDDANLLCKNLRNKLKINGLPVRY